MRFFAGVAAFVGAALCAQSDKVSGKYMVAFVMAFSMLFLSTCIDAVCDTIRKTKKGSE